MLLHPVSQGNPGTRDSAQLEPQSVEKAMPCHASPDSGSDLTSFTPTAILLESRGFTAIDGSFCCRTSAGPPTEEPYPNVDAVGKFADVTLMLEPDSDAMPDAGCIEELIVRRARMKIVASDSGIRFAMSLR